MENLLENQRRFFATGATRALEYRISRIKTLRQALREHERALYEALAEDLGKPEFEAFAGEIGVLYEEIDHTLKHLPGWIKPRRVPTPLALFRSTSRIYAEPKGQVLILAPWNYPVLLSLTPALGALAAGNTVVLKPSEFAPATGRALKKMLDRAFPPEELLCLEGDAELSARLTRLPFNHIFFTGSTAVGRKVYEAAAKNLVPVTLELGGKSPCVVDAKTNLDVTARRIVWGKFLNAGQTCVAPDTVYADENIYEKLLYALKAEMQSQFGADALAGPDLARIVNRKHFDRLTGYLREGTVAHGGETAVAGLKIAPTLLTEAHGRVMEEEIFGPILPLVPYRDFAQLKSMLTAQPQPLAFYVFSEDDRFVERCLAEFSFGGGCINDCMIHLGNPNLPFGGVGASGLGGYHGETSFLTFSHRKSVVHHAFFPEFFFRYRPYGRHLPWLKRVMRTK